jgi:hypothetical protein
MKQLLFLIIVSVGSVCFSQSLPLKNFDSAQKGYYDIRSGLEPKRLTIAMWDYSWMWGHCPGGYLEDYERSFDELKERGFNTVRIDALPLILHQLKEKGKDSYTKEVDPMANWGFTTRKFDYPVRANLLEFMKLAEEKGVYVILSSWGLGDKGKYAEKKRFWEAWEFTLDILKEKSLLDNVLYVDFDQEFPYFSPFEKQLNSLRGKKSEEEVTSLPANMQVPGSNRLRWNQKQMAFVKDYFESTLSHFQMLYPGLRFTFSLTNFWDEIRLLKIHKMDVLELHFWIDDKRFSARTDWEDIPKNRNPQNDYKKYMEQIRSTMKSMRPMLLKDMENKMAFAHSWAREMAVPLTTTEGWGPWWHMDHKDLDWEWLYYWCADCVELSKAYNFWGVTPWNFSHPYWANWSNVDWYLKVNNSFLKN